MYIEKSEFVIKDKIIFRNKYKTHFTIVIYSNCIFKYISF